MLFILATTGCKKLVQVDEPDDSLTAGTVFSNDSLAQAAVAGLYIKIMSSTKFLLNGGMSLFPSLSADELQRTIAMNSEDQFYINAINPRSLTVNTNFWKAAYAYIYQCNICIEGLSKSTGVTAAVKNRLSGEVKFVRALCYYYLVNLYGDVPLVLGTNAEVNALLPRTSVNQVYKQMETDLVAAADALTDAKENTTPTTYAAKALLARVYLHLSDNTKAEEMASAVINAGQFSLQSDLNAVFKSNSKETIFQWAPVMDKINAAEGFMFIQPNPGIRPTYVLTTNLKNAFEGDDLRMQHWVGMVTSGTQTYYYPYKYKIYQSINGNAPTEYNVVLRLAEQYLIRAEALARQGKIAQAVADINTIRTRAQLPDISTSIGNDACLQAIEQERRIELFAEWGHRWFDLKRTNRADAVLSAVKGSNWHPHDRLYPIPFTELELDPNLKQNPGYD
ncbi:RagB/SusD family nutrient uptake outer membrane protein [Niastella caeni]|nr:RagB/SusD family nutrient uptake outer membrane protein [Niastella caeni]